MAMAESDVVILQGNVIVACFIMSQRQTEFVTLALSKWTRSRIVAKFRVSYARSCKAPKSRRRQKKHKYWEPLSLLNLALHISKCHAVDPSLTRQTTAFPSTPQKCNISDISFRIWSTETTPTKPVKPETDIQHLQDILIANILRALYGNLHVKAIWPRERKLNLCYEQ